MARRTRAFNIPGDLEWLRALGLIRKRSKGRWTRDAIERRLAYLESCIEHNLIPDARGRCLSQHGRSAVLVISQPLASDDLGAAAQQMDRIEVLMRDTCEAARRAIAMRQHLASENLETAAQRVECVTAMEDLRETMLRSIAVIQHLASENLEAAAQRMECVTAPDGLAVHMEDLCEGVAVARRALASEGIESVAERMDGIEALVRDMCDRVSRPHAERGQKFSLKGTDAANKERKRLKESRKQQVIGLAQRLLNEGGYRRANNEINRSALAKACEVASRVGGGNIGSESARKIVSAAIRRGDLV